MNTPLAINTMTLPDEEVIERVLRGDKNGYELIIRKYNQRLYRVCMSIINDDDEAEDIMQTAYIKAYENLSRFEFKSNFGTWITRILINEALLRLKKKQRFETMDNHNAAKITDSQTPLKKVLNKELKQALESAIAMLPEKYRMVFMMREVEEMSIAETVDSLKITEANVKVRLNRAKTLLKTSLMSQYKNEEVYQFQLTRCNRVVHQVLKYIA